MIALLVKLATTASLVVLGAVCAIAAFFFVVSWVICWVLEKSRE